MQAEGYLEEIKGQVLEEFLLLYQEDNPGTHNPGTTEHSE